MRRLSTVPQRISRLQTTPNRTNVVEAIERAEAAVRDIQTNVAPLIDARFRPGTARRVTGSVEIGDVIHAFTTWVGRLHELCDSLPASVSDLNQSLTQLINDLSGASRRLRLDHNVLSEEQLGLLALRGLRAITVLERLSQYEGTAAQITQLSGLYATGLNILATGNSNGFRIIMCAADVVENPQTNPQVRSQLLAAAAQNTFSSLSSQIARSVSGNLRNLAENLPPEISERLRLIATRTEHEATPANLEQGILVLAFCRTIRRSLNEISDPESRHNLVSIYRRAMDVTEPFVAALQMEIAAAYSDCESDSNSNTRRNAIAAISDRLQHDPASDSMRQNAAHCLELIRGSRELRANLRTLPEELRAAAAGTLDTVDNLIAERFVHPPNTPDTIVALDRRIERTLGAMYPIFDNLNEERISAAQRTALTRLFTFALANYSQGNMEIAHSFMIAAQRYKQLGTRDQVDLLRFSEELNIGRLNSVQFDIILEAYNIKRASESNLRHSDPQVRATLNAYIASAILAAHNGDETLACVINYVASAYGIAQTILSEPRYRVSATDRTHARDTVAFAERWFNSLSAAAAGRIQLSSTEFEHLVNELQTNYNRARGTAEFERTVNDLVNPQLEACYSRERIRLEALARRAHIRGNTELETIYTQRALGSDFALVASSVASARELYQQAQWETTESDEALRNAYAAERAGNREEARRLRAQSETTLLQAQWKMRQALSILSGVRDLNASMTLGTVHRDRGREVISAGLRMLNAAAHGHDAAGDGSELQTAPQNMEALVIRGQQLVGQGLQEVRRQQAIERMVRMRVAHARASILGGAREDLALQIEFMLNALPALSVSTAPNHPNHLSQEEATRLFREAGSDLVRLRDLYRRIRSELSISVPSQTNSGIDDVEQTQLEYRTVVSYYQREQFRRGARATGNSLVRQGIARIVSTQAIVPELMRRTVSDSAAAENPSYVIGLALRDPNAAASPERFMSNRDMVQEIIHTLPQSARGEYQRRFDEIDRNRDTATTRQIQVSALFDDIVRSIAPRGASAEETNRYRVGFVRRILHGDTIAVDQSTIDSRLEHVRELQRTGDYVEALRILATTSSEFSCAMTAAGPESERVAAMARASATHAQDEALLARLPQRPVSSTARFSNIEAQGPDTNHPLYQPTMNYHEDIERDIRETREAADAALTARDMFLASTGGIVVGHFASTSRIPTRVFVIDAESGERLAFAFTLQQLTRHLPDGRTLGSLRDRIRSAQTQAERNQAAREFFYAVSGSTDEGIQNTLQRFGNGISNEEVRIQYNAELLRNRNMQWHRNREVAWSVADRGLERLAQAYDSYLDARNAHRDATNPVIERGFDGRTRPIYSQDYFARAVAEAGQLVCDVTAPSVSIRMPYEYMLLGEGIPSRVQEPRNDLFGSSPQQSLGSLQIIDTTSGLPLANRLALIHHNMGNGYAQLAVDRDHARTVFGQLAENNFYSDMNTLGLSVARSPQTQDIQSETVNWMPIAGNPLLVSRFTASGGRYEIGRLNPNPQQTQILIQLAEQNRLHWGMTVTAVMQSAPGLASEFSVRENLNAYLDQVAENSRRINRAMAAVAVQGDESERRRAIVASREIFGPRDMIVEMVTGGRITEYHSPNPRIQRALDQLEWSRLWTFVGTETTKFVGMALGSVLGPGVSIPIGAMMTLESAGAFEYHENWRELVPTNEQEFAQRAFHVLTGVVPMAVGPLAQLRQVLRGSQIVRASSSAAAAAAEADAFASTTHFLGAFGIDYMGVSTAITAPDLYSGYMRGEVSSEQLAGTFFSGLFMAQATGGAIFGRRMQMELRRETYRPMSWGTEILAHLIGRPLTPREIRAGYEFERAISGVSRAERARFMYMLQAGRAAGTFGAEEMQEATRMLTSGNGAQAVLDHFVPRARQELFAQRLQGEMRAQAQSIRTQLDLEYRSRHRPLSPDQAQERAARLAHLSALEAAVQMASLSELHEAASGLPASERSQIPNAERSLRAAAVVVEYAEAVARRNAAGRFPPTNIPTEIFELASRLAARPEFIRAFRAAERSSAIPEEVMQARRIQLRFGLDTISGRRHRITVMPIPDQNTQPSTLTSEPPARSNPWQFLARVDPRTLNQPEVATQVNDALDILGVERNAGLMLLVGIAARARANDPTREISLEEIQSALVRASRLPRSGTSLTSAEARVEALRSVPPEEETRVDVLYTAPSSERPAAKRTQTETHPPSILDVLARVGSSRWHVGGVPVTVRGTSATFQTGEYVRGIERLIMNQAIFGQDLDVVVITGDKNRLNDINNSLGWANGDRVLFAYREVVSRALNEAAEQNGQTYAIRPSLNGDETIGIIIVPAGHGREARQRFETTLANATREVFTERRNHNHSETIGPMVDLVNPTDPQVLVRATVNTGEVIEFRRGEGERVTAHYVDSTGVRTDAFITRPNGSHEVLSAAIRRTDEPAFTPQLNHDLHIQSATEVIYANNIEQIAPEAQLSSNGLAFEARLDITNEDVMNQIRQHEVEIGKGLSEVLARSFGIRGLNTFFGHYGSNYIISLVEQAVGEFASANGLTLRRAGTMKYVIENGTPEQLAALREAVDRRVAAVSMRTSDRIPFARVQAGSNRDQVAALLAEARIALETERRSSERSEPHFSELISLADSTVAAFNLLNDQTIRTILGDNFQTLRPIIGLVRGRQDIRNFEDLVFALRNQQIGGANGPSLERNFRQFLRENESALRAEFRQLQNSEPLISATRLTHPPMSMENTTLLDRLTSTERQWISEHFRELPSSPVFAAAIEIIRHCENGRRTISGRYDRRTREIAFTPEAMQQLAGRSVEVTLIIDPDTGRINSVSVAELSSLVGLQIMERTPLLEDSDGEPTQVFNRAEINAEMRRREIPLTLSPGTLHSEPPRGTATGVVTAIGSPPADRTFSNVESVIRTMPVERAAAARQIYETARSQAPLEQIPVEHRQAVGSIRALIAVAEDSSAPGPAARAQAQIVAIIEATLTQNLQQETSTESRRDRLIRQFSSQLAPAVDEVVELIVRYAGLDPSNRSNDDSFSNLCVFVLLSHRPGREDVARVITEARRHLNPAQIRELNFVEQLWGLGVLERSTTSEALPRTLQTIIGREAPPSLSQHEHLLAANRFVFPRGASEELQAHGVSSQKGGLYSLLGIIMEGAITAGYLGPLRGPTSESVGPLFGQSSYAGNHGPFYVVVEHGVMPIPSSAEPILEAHHNAYVVPSANYRESIALVLAHAVSSGMMSREEALTVLSKVVTYQEFGQAPELAFGGSNRTHPNGTGDLTASDHERIERWWQSRRRSAETSLRNAETRYNSLGIQATHIYQATEHPTASGAGQREVARAQAEQAAASVYAERYVTMVQPSSETEAAVLHIIQQETASSADIDRQSEIRRIAGEIFREARDVARSAPEQRVRNPELNLAYELASDMANDRNRVRDSPPIQSDYIYGAAYVRSLRGHDDFISFSSHAPQTSVHSNAQPNEQQHIDVLINSQSNNPYRVRVYADRAVLVGVEGSSQPPAFLRYVRRRMEAAIGSLEERFAPTRAQVALSNFGEAARIADIIGRGEPVYRGYEAQEVLRILTAPDPTPDQINQALASFVQLHRDQQEAIINSAQNASYSSAERLWQVAQEHRSANREEAAVEAETLAMFYQRKRAAHLRELCELNGSLGQRLEHEHNLPPGSLSTVYVIAGGDIRIARENLADHLGIEIRKNPRISDPYMDHNLFSLITSGDLISVIRNSHSGTREISIGMTNSGAVGAYEVVTFDGNRRYIDFVKALDMRPDQVGSENLMRSGIPASRTTVTDMAGNPLMFRDHTGNLTGYGISQNLADFNGEIRIGGRNIRISATNTAAVHYMFDNEAILNLYLNHRDQFYQQLGYALAGQFALGSLDGSQNNLWGMTARIENPTREDFEALRRSGHFVYNDPRTHEAMIFLFSRIDTDDSSGSYRIGPDRDMLSYQTPFVSEVLENLCEGIATALNRVERDVAAREGRQRRIYNKQTVYQEMFGTNNRPGIFVGIRRWYAEHYNLAYRNAVVGLFRARAGEPAGVAYHIAPTDKRMWELWRDGVSYYRDVPYNGEENMPILPGTGNRPMNFGARYERAIDIDPNDQHLSRLFPNGQTVYVVPMSLEQAASYTTTIQAQNGQISVVFNDLQQIPAGMRSFPVVRHGTIMRGSVEFGGATGITTQECGPELFFDQIMRLGERGFVRQFRAMGAMLNRRL